LSPSTFYWIVASSTIQRSYQWYYSGQTYVSSDGWALGGAGISYDGGNTWSGNATTYLFAVNASTSTIPEPETCELLGLALATIFFRKKMPKQIHDFVQTPNMFCDTGLHRWVTRKLW
jgi:hypothetical protein